MNFPSTNKVRNPNAPVEVEFGDNLNLLEKRLSATNWNALIKYYSIIFGVVTLSVAIFIFIIRVVFAIHL